MMDRVTLHPFSLLLLYQAPCMTMFSQDSIQYQLNIALTDKDVQYS